LLGELRLEFDEKVRMLLKYYSILHSEEMG
jgi:hypothetical protein